jgi:flagellar basal body-associated protein FliL
MTRFATRSSRRRGKVKAIVMLLVALVLGAGGSYAVFGRKASATPESAAGHKGEEGEAKEDEPEAPLEYVNLGAFLVNVLAEQGLRYLRVEVTVGVAEPEGDKGKGKKKGGEGHGEGGKGKAPALSPADDARARDAVVRVLSGQSYEQLRSIGPSIELKRAVTEELRKAVRDVEVKVVMFTSFVMQ